MKVETRVTEKVTVGKEEKVLTISESEFEDVMKNVIKKEISEISDVKISPIIMLPLTLMLADVSTELHMKLFNGKENK